VKQDNPSRLGFLQNSSGDPLRVLKLGIECPDLPSNQRNTEFPQNAEDPGIPESRGLAVETGFVPGPFFHLVLTRQDFFPDSLGGEKIHRPKVMIGMIADEMSCPGRGGD
jgi:hypothetical protein